MKGKKEKSETVESCVDDVATDVEYVEDQQQQELEAQEGDQLAILQAELEQAQSQATEYLDGWQRARAEFANYKKRVEAERDDIRCRSNEALLLKLLPILDDFERAFQTVPPELAEVVWVDGVRMIMQKLQTLLESEKVVAIQAKGQPFNPQWHEAIMQEETTDYPDGTVVEEMRRGYQLADRVLRPSMVRVASNPNT